MEPRRLLPEKKYFKIGEVADLVGVEPHVLRYWETQFPQVRPHKARSGHRLYRRREVETLLVIRELLHVQRFTIAGAKQALRQPGATQSLLPRFFATPSDMGRDGGAGGAGSAFSGAHTLLAHDDDADDDDANETVAGAGDSVVEVEAHGIDDDDELRAALDRQSAERSGTIVEVQVEPVTRAPPRPALRERDVSRERELPREREREIRAAAAPTPPPAPVKTAAMPGLGPLPLSAAKKLLLQAALGEAHAVLAILDREDARDRRAHA